MSKSIVVAGEASESEDEVKVNSLTKYVKGAVIIGEDSESDTEIESSTLNANSVLNKKELVDNKISFDSLFHQKLREQNLQLYSSIEDTCQSTVNDANKQLNVIEQQLVRSQATMQNAVTSLKSLSINSLTIKSKLHSLLSSNFLSNVILPK